MMTDSCVCIIGVTHAGKMKRKRDTPACEVIVWSLKSFSLAVVSCSTLLGCAGALLQHQHGFPMLLQSHCVRLHVLKDKIHKHGWWPSQISISVDLNMWCRQTNTYLACMQTHYTYMCVYTVCRRCIVQDIEQHVVKHTFRMRMKSCLSTRRKWQLSSLKIIVAARGASFSKASCPKSSPSCSVVTSPYMQAVSASWHYTRQQWFWDLFVSFGAGATYLPMCDHIYRAFPDDVPRGAFIPLTEHYIKKRHF